MGVPADDAENVGRLVGLKTIVNEFAAYERLGRMKLEGKIGKRAEQIATFALCGFANPVRMPHSFIFLFILLFILSFIPCPICHRLESVFDYLWLLS